MDDNDNHSGRIFALLQSHAEHAGRIIVYLGCSPREDNSSQTPNRGNLVGGECRSDELGSRGASRWATRENHDVEGKDGCFQKETRAGSKDVRQ